MAVEDIEVYIFAGVEVLMIPSARGGSGSFFFWGLFLRKYYIREWLD